MLLVNSSCTSCLARVVTLPHSILAGQGLQVGNIIGSSDAYVPASRAHPSAYSRAKG